MKNKQTLTHVDATGFNCPMPLMLLKQAIDGLSAGDDVEISVTDQHAELDFEIWCERFGHSLEKIQEKGDVILFSITKSGLC